MKTKIALFVFSLGFALPTFAGGTIDAGQGIPEPSTLGLFAAAAIAIAVLAKFKK